MTTEQKIELASELAHDRTLYESKCMREKTIPKKYRVVLTIGMTIT
jgi:alkylhydroperoxidase/carboxymuconolactone decarboxylase family protein YurZ